MEGEGRIRKVNVWYMLRYMLLYPHFKTSITVILKESSFQLMKIRLSSNSEGTFEVESTRYSQIPHLFQRFSSWRACTCKHHASRSSKCLPGNSGQHVPTSGRYRSPKVPACQQACSPFAPSKAENYWKWASILSYVYATSAVSRPISLIFSNECLTITKHPKTKFPQIPITRRSHWHEAGECQGDNLRLFKASLPISWHIQCHALAISWGYLRISLHTLAYLRNISAISWHILAFVWHFLWQNVSAIFWAYLAYLGIP